MNEPQRKVSAAIENVRQVRETAWAIARKLAGEAVGTNETRSERKRYRQAIYALCDHMRDLDQLIDAWEREDATEKEQP